MASASNLPESAALALLNFAREGSLAGGSRFDDELLNAAVLAFPAPTRGAVEKFVERI